MVRTGSPGTTASPTSAARMAIVPRGGRTQQHLRRPRLDHVSGRFRRGDASRRQGAFLRGRSALRLRIARLGNRDVGTAHAPRQPWRCQGPATKHPIARPARISVPVPGLPACAQPAPSRSRAAASAPARRGHRHRPGRGPIAPCRPAPVPTPTAAHSSGLFSSATGCPRCTACPGSTRKRASRPLISGAMRISVVRTIPADGASPAVRGHQYQTTTHGDHQHRHGRAGARA